MPLAVGPGFPSYEMVTYKLVFRNMRWGRQAWAAALPHTPSTRPSPSVWDRPRLPRPAHDVRTLAVATSLLPSCPTQAAPLARPEGARDTPPSLCSGPPEAPTSQGVEAKSSLRLPWPLYHRPPPRPLERICCDPPILPSPLLQSLLPWMHAGQPQGLCCCGCFPPECSSCWSSPFLVSFRSLLNWPLPRAALLDT